MTGGRTVRSPLRLLVRWESFLLLVLFATLLWGSHVSRYFVTSSNISIALASPASWSAYWPACSTA